jgi:protein arginine kinase activator
VLLPAEEPAADQVACPGCGLTTAAWLASGQVGCSDCYDTFEATLRSLVPALAQDLPHLGRRPDSAPPAAASQRAADAVAAAQLTILVRELQEAVAREDFERAAALRDAVAQRRATVERG